MRQLSLAIVIAAFGMFCAPAALAQPTVITPAGKASILAAPATPFAGAPKGAVTVVEYFDVNCPYCKPMAPEIDQLISTTPGVRVLYKDWPIFGGVSVYAARAGLAARWQNRYLQAHTELMRAPGRLASEAQVRDRLKAASVDLPRLDRDLVAHAAEINAILARNDAEAKRLAFQGTPGFVVGNFVVPGGMKLDDLRKLVELSRPAKEGTSR